MNNNFDLAKFLTENKLTTVGRLQERALLKEGFHSMALDREAERLDYTKPKTPTIKKLGDLTFNSIRTIFQYKDFDRGIHFPAEPGVTVQVKTAEDFERWKQSKLDQWGSDVEVKLSPAATWYEKVQIIDPEVAAHDEKMISSKMKDVTGFKIDESEEALDLPMEGEEMEDSQGEDFSKYKSVEELMKEIENSTNEAAHKHKMERVKAAYESLEAKASSLEEGEHSAYISTSKIKEMKIASKKLRKMYESLSKVYEKKYAKKEK